MTTRAADRLVVEAAGSAKWWPARPPTTSTARPASRRGPGGAALRQLLSVLVPTNLGGDGVTISRVAEACAALARSCASTAMIYAMHQMQVACLVRHGRSFF